MRDPGLAVFGARMPPGSPSSPITNAMLKVLERDHTHLSDIDVAHERRRAVNEMENVLRSTDDFALEIGDWAAMGDWRLFFFIGSAWRMCPPPISNEWPVSTSQPRTEPSRSFCLARMVAG